MHVCVCLVFPLVILYILIYLFCQGGYLRRRLAETDVPYTVTVPGTTSAGLTQSINHFQNNFLEVPSRLGVTTDDVSDLIDRSIDRCCVRYVLRGSPFLFGFCRVVFVFVFVFLAVDEEEQDEQTNTREHSVYLERCTYV